MALPGLQVTSLFDLLAGQGEYRKHSIRGVNGRRPVNLIACPRDSTSFHQHLLHSIFTAPAAGHPEGDRGQPISQ
jgi:hypothetical protein